MVHQWERLCFVEGTYTDSSLSALPCIQVVSRTCPVYSTYTDTTVNIYALESTLEVREFCDRQAVLGNPRDKTPEVKK